MSIQRINPEARWSDAVIHNNIIYYTSVPTNKDGDIISQTSDVLGDIETMLNQLGSDKERIIDATIFLADAADFPGMNSVWDSWVIAGKAPVRCTVQATLMNPKYKIEIKIIAAQ